jgi:hypothetical protein
LTGADARPEPDAAPAPPGGDPHAPGKRLAWQALLLAAVAALIYANALSNDFVFDDLVTFRQDRNIRSLSTVPRIFTTPEGSFRPVRNASFALDYALSGDEPWGYHLCNIAYHAACAFLVLLLLRRLTGSGRAALIGALLFCVHPVHTESVAYVSGRRDVLTALFFLLGLLAYLRYRRRGQARWILAALGSWLLALGAKEMAITLPAVVFLHDLVLDRAALRRHAPIYAVGGALVVAAAAWILLSEHRVASGFHGGDAVRHYATIPRLLVHDLSLLVAPVHLLADYSFEAFPLSHGFTDVRTLVAVAMLLIVGGIAVAERRRAPLVTFGIGWFFVTIAPVSQLVPYHELAAEHWLYLPSVGFCLVVGWGVEALARRFGTRPVLGILAVVLVAFGARTMVRNLDWKDEETLWRVTAEAAPGCARAQRNLGAMLARRRRWGEAEARLRASLAIQPEQVYGRAVLAEVLKRSGDPAGARRELEEALVWARRLERPRVPPRAVLIALGRYAEALPEVESFLKQHPRKAVVWRQLAMCRAALGDPGGALDAYDAYLRLRPQDAAVLRRAAELARQAGLHDRADGYERRRAAVEVNR